MTLITLAGRPPSASPARPALPPGDRADHATIAR